jgi:ribosomal protein L22
MKYQESSSNNFKRKILKVIKNLIENGEQKKAFDLYQKYFEDK